jgi:ATP/maltotriose-dependent transcriptional regulator MalT
MTTLDIQNLTRKTEKTSATISRERLTALLRNNAEKNLILIYSPPGYGKTTLVESFLETYKIKSAWLSASPAVNHIYSFFRYLIFSLKQFDKNFGDNTLLILESRREKNQLTRNIKSIANEIVKTFVKEFENVFKEDIVLVIDDFQDLADSKWAIEVFNTLLENIPDRLHLIIVTRQLPEFNFTTLTEKDKMIKIGIEDLMFRFDEIIALIEKIYSVEYTESQIEILENNLGGWITGIHLILQSFGKDLKNLKLDYQVIPENIFNVLAEEILNQLDENTADFVLKSSMLKSFDAQLCNYVLGINNSGDIINQLLSKNLVTKTDPAYSGNGYSATFSYPALFKKYFNSRFNDIYSEDFIRILLIKAAEYFSEKSEIAESVNYYISAGDFDSAIPLIIKNFNSMFYKGKFEYLWMWLSALENETDLENPYIVYYLGIIYKFYVGNLEKSFEFLENAVKLASMTDDKDLLIKCQIAKAGVMLNLGKSKSVIDELSGLIKEKSSAENKAYLLYHLGHAYYHNSDYDKCISLLEETLKLIEDGAQINKQSDIYNLFGHIELIKGNFIKSVVFYEKVLEGNPNIFNKFETLCNLVLMTSQGAQYSKAKKYLAQIDEMINTFPTPVFNIPYMLARQAYLFESGSYEENLKVLKEIMNIAQSMNHKTYIYLSSRLLCDTYSYMGNLAKAKEYYDISDKYIDKDNELEAIEMQTIDAVLNKENMNGTYEKTLLDTYKYYQTNHYIYSGVQTSYRLAAYYLENNDADKAKKYIEDSLKTASENGYAAFFNREYSLSKNLMQFALNNDICRDFVKSIIKNFN